MVTPITANLYLMMEQRRDKATGLPFRIYAIDMNKKERGEYITSYLPEAKECKPIL